MISGLPKVDYTINFEPNKGLDDRAALRQDEILINRLLRNNQYQAQLAAKANTDIEQKYGQLYQLTNQEIDGQWADKFQEMFSTQFAELSDLAQKNDPSFWSKRQKVAQSVVDFKNQIKQAQGIRDQIKTTLESDPAYAHINKNQFTEYIIRKNFYNTTQSPDGKVNTQTLKNPGDIKGITSDEIKAEAMSMSNPFINKDFVLSGVAKSTPFMNKIDVDERILTKDKKLRSTIETELPEYASYSSKTGVVIDPAKLEAFYKDKKDKIPGLEAYLNSIGNDYSKFASDLMLNPEFTKSIKAKVGSSEVMRFESQTTINNNPDKSSTGAGYQHAQNTVNEVVKSNSAAGTYDVSNKFDGYSYDAPSASGFGTTKQGFSKVTYTTGSSQPFKVIFQDNSSRSFSADGFKRYLLNLDATGSPYGESGGKKLPN